MSGGPLTAAGLSYEVDHGSVAKDVAYHGDMTLLPHLAGILSLGGIRARLVFRKVRVGDASRKQLANELREEVSRLRATPLKTAAITTPADRRNCEVGCGSANRGLMFSGPGLKIANGHAQNPG